MLEDGEGEVLEGGAQVNGEADEQRLEVVAESRSSTTALLMRFSSKF